LNPVAVALVTITAGSAGGQDKNVCELPLDELPITSTTAFAFALVFAFALAMAHPAAPCKSDLLELLEPCLLLLESGSLLLEEDRAITVETPDKSHPSP
jgi:hypothetical protein